LTSDIEPTIRRAQPEDRDEVNTLVRAFHAEDGHPISQRGLTAVRVMLEPDSLQGSIMLLKTAEQPGGYGALCLGSASNTKAARRSSTISISSPRCAATDTAAC
jgi:hypothetical protein